MGKELNLPTPEEKSEIIRIPNGPNIFLDGATWDELDPRDRQVIYDILEQHQKKNAVLALKEMEGQACHGKASTKRIL